jgi:hypothetical protein
MSDGIALVEASRNTHEVLVDHLPSRFWISRGGHLGRLDAARVSLAQKA